MTIKLSSIDRILKKDFIEITWLGRGGQGAVTASEILATSAIKEGKNAIAVPEFGAERRGAPVRAYTRISTSFKDIYKTPITKPDIFVLLDPSLLSRAKDYVNLDKDTVVVANTNITKDEAVQLLGKDVSPDNVFVIDASKIVMPVLGRPIFNTVMVGALLGVVGLVKLSTVLETTREYFKGKLGELNAKVIEEGFKHFSKSIENVKEVEASVRK